jgi:CRP-like cAMP-binding protein
MPELEKPAFDAEAFLASAGVGRRMVRLRGKQAFFSQGEAADSVFYLQSGRIPRGQSKSAIRTAFQHPIY